MKRKICMVVICLAVTAGMTWAGTQDNNPADFPTTINWCQFVCAGIPPGTPLSLGTPTPWTSSGADTGLVGLFGTGDNFQIYQEGNNWNGTFNHGEGVVYNGAESGNTQADITLGFDQAEFGAGAYIQADPFGAFTATISLYDISDLLIGTDTFSEAGNNTGSEGTAIFIGAYDPTADVYFADFSVTAVASPFSQGLIDDFGIGTAGVMDSLPVVTGTPEPASMLLIGSALLGLAAFGRKRIMNSWRGNS